MADDTGIYKFGALVCGSFIVLTVATAQFGRGEQRPAVVKRDPPAQVRTALTSAKAARTSRGTLVCTPQGGTRPLGDEVHESSGVAVSGAHAGIFWTHNDSGDPLLYAIDAQGRMAGTVRVTGAQVQDWEDVSRAPCPGGNCLFVADIGDNQAKRPFVTVYRVREPAPSDTASAPAEAIRLRYPDGAQDAEAMFVLNGAIHIVTKGETGPIAVYRAPVSAAPGEPSTLERTRNVTPDKVKRSERITGADASPDGRWVAMRTLDDVVIYAAAELIGSAPLAPRRVSVKSLGEKQGEGIGFTPDGSLVLTSEGGKKEDAATFARLGCTQS
ncbi:hypothetical protein [Longimicrobium sp.]|jgi:hypothetical protein|uniref:hypothetical protein n=1 Tax=Longimicrobium sp. TaxID=2029185 RepID=UPI002F95A4AD